MVVVRVTENVRAVQSSYYSSCPWSILTILVSFTPSFTPSLTARLLTNAEESLHLNNKVKLNLVNSITTLKVFISSNKLSAHEIGTSQGRNLIQKKEKLNYTFIQHAFSVYSTSFQ
jgi:hypothetical protein